MIIAEEDDSNLPFNESDISSLRQARLKVIQDLVYLNCSVPPPDVFPVWGDLAELHRDLCRSRAIEADFVLGAVLNFKDSTFETFEAAKSLTAFLDARLALKKKLAKNGSPLLEQIAKHLGNMRSDDPLLSASDGRVRRSPRP